MRVVLALILLCLPLAAVAQEDDRGFITRLLEENLSGEGRTVRLIGFEGALSSRARVAEISIADAEGVWLSLRGVEMQWNRSALLRGAVDIGEITAEEIDLPRPPLPVEGALPTPEATPFSLPQLPVSVSIGRIAAGTVRLGAPVLGREIAVSLDGSARLEDGAGAARLTIERVDQIRGRLVLDTAYSNETGVLRVALDVAEPEGGIAATALGLPGNPSVRLVVGGEGPLDDFTADVALATDEEDRLTGQVALSGVEAGRAFRADLAGDLAPLFLPAYRNFFGESVALSAEGVRRDDGVTDLSALRLETAQLALEGRARLAADGLPLFLDLDLNLAAGDGTLVRLPLTGDPLDLRQAHLRLGFDAGAGEDWSLDGEVIDLRGRGVEIGALRLDGSGRIARDGGAPLVSGALELAATGLGFDDAGVTQALGSALAARTRFFWRAGEPLRLPDLMLEAGDLALAGDISVSDPGPALAIAGRVDAAAGDLSRFSTLAGRPLGGAGRIGWTGSFAPLSGALDGTLNVVGNGLSAGIAELDRLLSGESRITVSVARQEQGTHLRRLEIAAGPLSVRAQGWLRSTGSDLTAEFAFADLSVLGGPWRGRVVAEAALTDAGGTQALSLTATAVDLAVGQPLADGLLRGETQLSLAADRRGDRIGIARLAIDGAAVAAELQGWLEPAARDLTGRVALRDLSRAGGGFRGALEASFAHTLETGTETLRLDGTGRDLGIGSAEADRLLRGTTNLSLAAARQSGIVRVERIELGNPQIDLRGTGQVADDASRLDLTAQLADLALLVPGITGPVVVQGQVAEVTSGYGLTLSARGPGGIDARASGTVAADFARADLRIDGAADLGLANAFLTGAALRGPVRFDLGLNGAPGLAALSGRIELQGTRAVVSQPPLSFSNLSGTVTLGGGQAQLQLGAALDTGGALRVSGPVGLAAPFPGQLSVELDNLRLTDPQLYTTRVNGRLGVSGPLAGGAMISGAIRLAETELRIPSTGLGGSFAIPDLRHVGEPAAVRRTRARAGLLDGTGRGTTGTARPYGLDVAIDAPNRIFIRGRGLDAELGGSVLIQGTTANVVPSGGFSLIRGRLDLLGRRFNLDEGRLALEGALIPQVLLSATTEAEGVQASIVIEGPADAPEIRFVSAPELPEEEVVARLLFGRGLTSLTPLQAAQLASAVATLTGRGGAGVVDRVRRSFGLDDLDITGGENGGAAVRAGRYLSRNVYADVTVDSEGRSDISLNLDVGRNFTVRGRASSDGSTGLGVYFERDY